MIVLDVNNGDSGHFAPVQPTIVFSGHWTMRRLKHDAIGVLGIHRKTALQIAFEFMTSSRKWGTNVFEAGRRTEVIKPLFYLFRTLRSVRLAALLILSELLAKLAGAKQDVHKLSTIVNLMDQ